MRVVYHPKVQKDVNRILRHYENASGKLADEFWDELTACIARTAENPGRSHFSKARLRRVNLPRFPYHFLFRELPGKIRVTVVRHNKRHPDYGTKRR
jgi:plasmid stabilization system protein ParE